MIAVAILLPWLALLVSGRFLPGFLCLILQVTVLGWVPAALWAVLVVNEDRRERQYQEMLRILRGR
ncbi:MAG TPA: YqaE/Pmp3 family membrane protein [Acetobacteraceae bacterium]|nr:YqaE/Pmp3 family membrane protein [Acetobacteraceae bacterium]